LVAFSPDAQMVVSASSSSIVSVWNADTGALVARDSKHAEGTLTGRFTSSSSYWFYCAISPDGRWRAYKTGSKVEVFDLQTGELAAAYERLTGSVLAVAFSPDSKRVLSASEDTTIQVHTLDC